MTGVLEVDVRGGYDARFLDVEIPVPVPVDGVLADVAPTVDGGPLVRHVHFSLQMSASRRFALWVGWNIDGGSLGRSAAGATGSSEDPQIAADAQVGDDLYAGNRLDRGHIARRADLLWGSPRRGRARQPRLVLLHQHRAAARRLQPEHAGRRLGPARGRRLRRRRRPGPAGEPLRRTGLRRRRPHLPRGPAAARVLEGDRLPGGRAAPGAGLPPDPGPRPPGAAGPRRVPRLPARRRGGRGAHRPPLPGRAARRRRGCAARARRRRARRSAAPPTSAGEPGPLPAGRRPARPAGRRRRGRARRGLPRDEHVRPEVQPRARGRRPPAARGGTPPSGPRPRARTAGPPSRRRAPPPSRGRRRRPSRPAAGPAPG